jgi:plasmid stabilization system protein ParE
MPKEIIWSELADNDFEDILEYLAKNWNQKVASKFMTITFHFIDQIAVHPKQFPMIYKKEKIRKCVITKQNTLFYKESKANIEILRIFDTRQNPKKLTVKD